MKKSIKITLAVLTVATALIIIVPLGISKFSQQEEVINTQVKIEEDTDVVSLSDIEVTVENKVSIPEDAEPVTIIEEDKETGALTVTNEDGDVEVINDKALEEAQKTETKAKEILENALDDVIAEEDKNSYTETVKEVKKEKEIEQVKKDNKNKEQKDSSDEIDQETIDIFNDLGWGEPTTDHGESGIPEDAVWTQQESKTKVIFTTP
jgi:hypothetical protein